MKDQEIIKKSDKRKKKKFRHVLTGKKLMTRVIGQENRKKCFNTTV